MATATQEAPAKTGAEKAAETRKARSEAKLEQAKDLLVQLAKSGPEWMPSAEIHKRLGGQISEGMFGRAKAALEIPHRRVKGDNGKAQYEWNLGKLKGSK